MENTEESALDRETESCYVEVSDTPPYVTLHRGAMTDERRDQVRDQMASVNAAKRRRIDEAVVGGDIPAGYPGWTD